ncbi:hypothetical protein GOODEAATRI_005941, partial [Goodea atripinnis]
IVRQDRTMEEIVFPVPNICEFLTSESKLRVYYTTERDEQGSKINDFFLRAEDLFNEMNWQKKLRGTLEPRLSALLWMGVFAALFLVVLMPQPLGILALVAVTILRLIFSVGLEPTLFLLGAFNVSELS